MRSAIDAFLRYATSRSVSKGDFIRDPDTGHMPLGYVIDGQVIVESISDTGKSLTLHIVNQGDLFGEQGALDKTPDFPVSAQMRIPGTVATMSPRRFSSLVSVEPNLLLFVAQQLAAKSNRFVERNINHEFYGLKAAIYRVLCEIAQQSDSLEQPDGRMIRYTRKQLAAYVGCCREQASRFVRELEKDGLVRIQQPGHKIILLRHRPAVHAA